MSLKSHIVSVAKSHGADLIGVAPVHVYTEYVARVRAQLQETGSTGEDYRVSGDALSYFQHLSDVHRTLPSARSLVLLGVYSLDRESDYRQTTRTLQGKTARTYGYYPVVRQVAEAVAARIEKGGYRAVQGQPVPLKHAAQAIGLGTYGWNGLLLTRDFGSYVALRAVVTDAKLEPDDFEPPEVPCRDCGQCLRACPTGALYAPYKVNPALCINPLTRREDAIPKELQPKMGNWVCGCDVCQEVCPINRRLTPRKRDPRAEFDPSHHASHRTLQGLTACPDLKALLKNDCNPVMQRNAAIALANIDSPGARDLLRRHQGREKARGEHTDPRP